MKPATESIFSDPESYELFVGRWSRLVAHPFIHWLAVPTERAWLDVGAGTGVLTQVILNEAAPSKVVGVDLSPEYLGVARQRVTDDRVKFILEDAAAIAFDAPEFDTAVTGLVLNFVPSPEAVINAMKQAVRENGVIAAYVWDYGGQMEMLRHFWDAATTVDPSAAEMDSGRRFTICKPDNLRALFESVNLSDVDVIPIDFETRFHDFDDYWQPILGAQGSLLEYLRGLDDETLKAIRDQLLTQLPITADGEILLKARAWAVKGRKVQ